MSCFSHSFDRFTERVLPPGMPEEGLLRIRAIAGLMRLAREQVADLSERRPALVFVARGAVKLVAHTATGREQVVGFHFAGELVTVPGPDTHDYCLQALADSELLVLPHSAFRQLAAGEPRILGTLLDTSEATLARSRDRSVALGRMTAAERVADFLLSMVPRIGVQRDDGTIVELPMSRRDIADSLGLTIETVSRQFTALREDGVIETSGRSLVRLLDTRALAVRVGRLSPVG